MIGRCFGDTDLFVVQRKLGCSLILTLCAAAEGQRLRFSFR